VVVKTVPPGGVRVRCVEVRGGIESGPAVAAAASVTPIGVESTRSSIESVSAVSAPDVGEPASGEDPPPARTAPHHTGRRKLAGGRLADPDAPPLTYEAFVDQRPAG